MTPMESYFLVTLKYRCLHNHGNRVHRVYQEENQAAVKLKISRDHLVCYSCPRGTALPSADIDFESDPIPNSTFKALNVSVGVDFSPETLL